MEMGKGKEKERSSDSGRNKSRKERKEGGGNKTQKQGYEAINVIIVHFSKEHINQITAICA